MIATVTTLARRLGAVFAISGLGLALALCVAPAVLAGNTYSAGTFSCQYGGGPYTPGNVIRVNPPLMTSFVGSAGLASISWKPTVYRWTNGRLVFYAGNSWIEGAANGNTSSGGWEENFEIFQNIPAGYYYVYNKYWWSSGATAGSYSPYVGGGYWCHF